MSITKPRTITKPRRATTDPAVPTLGNYEIIRRLASGGMGEVYLAKQRGPVAFSRDVVLKKLHPTYTRDPQFVTMFLNEAQIAANLTHPNIIHIYELFEDGDGYVIAMEYVRGGTVLTLLRGTARGTGLAFGPALRVAIAVCEALHYAYNDAVDDAGTPRHVIHRDVSPSNVLVGYDGHIKLADFGVAKTLDVNATRGTSIKGKYGYLSPEQVRCQPLDQRSDIFSVGILLWEMTTGRPLFHRENDVAMMYAVVEEPIPRPSEGNPDYPRDLEAVVMKALERDRDGRQATGNELASELRQVAKDHGWDLEAAALADLVRGALPENQVAFGRIGSDRFSGAGFGVPTGQGWSNPGSFPSLEVAPSINTAGPRSSRALLITILVMLALSIVFWVWIVPELL